MLITGLPPSDDDDEEEEDKPKYTQK